MSFLIEDIVTSVKDRSFAPISQNTFQEADIRRILDEELRLKLVKDLLMAREDFFYYRKTVAIVANKPLYMMPTKAIGNTLAALFYVDSANKQWPLTRRDIADLGDYSGVNGQPLHFFFQGDQVGLFPFPSVAGGSLLFVYARKPNRFIATTSCAKITASAANGSNTDFTVDTDLTASLAIGSKIDFLRGESPFALWADDVLITAISATVIQVATSAVDDVDGSVEPMANDYICPAGYANIPMIPSEFHPVLAQMGAVRLLRGLGDLNKLAEAKGELKELRSEALALIHNRSELAPDKVTRKNPLLKAFRG